MNTVGFPKMFKANSTIIKTNYEATRQCVKLLLASEKGEMFGDPEFGVKLKKFTFNQNNYILIDTLIDEIYEQITIFCPQVTITRNDITITQEGDKLYAHIKGINNVDFTTSTFDLVLLEGEDR